MKKLHYFFDIIDNDKSKSADDKNKLKDKLWLCHELTYHPNNISLMPVCGGLNNLKQVLGVDRIDTFLFTLQQYYENGINVYLLNFGQQQPSYTKYRNQLKGYLDSFGGIYDYCREIYHIYDENFVRKLCVSGKKAITNSEDIENYLNLVFQFWKYKFEFYKESNKNIQDCYINMLKECYDIIGKELHYGSFTGKELKNPQPIQNKQ